MRTLPAYDAYADWYEEYAGTGGNPYGQLVHDVLRDLLGPGAGTCLDLCCGAGARAHVLRELGWTPVGVDLSGEQLRHAVPRLPVAVGDAARLPVASESLPAVACVLAHTDLPDYAAVLREAARVLRPGGRFVHVGVHPCFVGAFADRSDPARIVVDGRYADRAYTRESWTTDGVRSRVGAWHVPLADMVNDIADAGLVPERATEAALVDVPDVFGFRATKPTTSTTPA